MLRSCLRSTTRRKHTQTSYRILSLLDVSAALQISWQASDTRRHCSILRSATTCTQKQTHGHIRCRGLCMGTSSATAAQLANFRRDFAARKAVMDLCGRRVCSCVFIATWRVLMRPVAGLLDRAHSYFRHYSPCGPEVVVDCLQLNSAHFRPASEVQQLCTFS